MIAPLLHRLHWLLARGLERTDALWPDIRRAYGWVHRAAEILKNEAGFPAGRAPLRWSARRDGAPPRHGRRAHRGHRSLSQGAPQRSAIHCYRVPDLPRTNNDLEHLFGAHRYHERRATGRKTASPAMVLRGAVRLLAATATQRQPIRRCDLARADHHAWRDLRQQLEARRYPRVLGRRFRHDPVAYLQQLEAALFQQTLPT